MEPTRECLLIPLANWSRWRYSQITARFVVNWAVRREEVCGHGFVPMLPMVRDGVPLPVRQSCRTYGH
jgi:hypothetical protein